MRRHSNLAACSLTILTVILAGCTGAIRSDPNRSADSSGPVEQATTEAVGSSAGPEAAPDTGDTPELPAAGDAPLPAQTRPDRDHRRTVDLDSSFHIPHGDNGDLSHTPALVFTRDGGRMVVATADQELIVFDAGSHAILARHRLEAAATDGVAIDPQGRMAAWVLEGGGLVVVDSRSGAIEARDDSAGATWVALDPKCRLLASSHGPAVEIRRVRDLEMVLRIDGSAGDITNLVWSGDGSRLATTSSGGRMQVLDTSTGEAVFAVDKKAPMYALDFHPTGERVAFGGKDNTVYQVELASGTEQVLSGHQPFWITCLAYSPDGVMIAVGDESCDVWLYEVGDREAVFHSKHHVECWLSQVAWATDNETFLFGCRPNTHAGKPSLYSPLNRVEAARSAKVRASRQALVDSIDAELAAGQTEEVATALERIKRALADEEKLEAHGANMAGAALQQQVATGNAQLQQVVQTEMDQAAQVQAVQNIIQYPQGSQLRRLAGAPAVDTSILPDETRQRLEEHQEAHQEAQQELQQSFVVNQWKVKR